MSDENEKTVLNEYQAKMMEVLLFLFGTDETEKMLNSYMLKRFEIDLLEAQFNKKFTFYNTPVLIEMQKKGYFKGIPDDIPIEEILNNCICLE